MASGQCYGCGTTFGIFRKEHGCKNCGFAFCNRCLPKSIEVPKHDNAKHHVCNRCHEILTGKADRERERQERERKAAPDAYYKRMAALQEGHPQVPHYGGMSYNYTPTPTAIKAIPPQYRGLSRVDADIAMRLDKLREKNQPLYSERDITDRLARLKGTKLPHHTAVCTPKPKFYHPPPERRPPQKQVDDLLNEICEEVEIDAKFDPAKDVEDRLVRFKDEPPRKDVPVKKPSAGNNLNTASSGPHKSYTKNIRSVSGERGSRDMTMDDVNTMIASMAKEMEVDAQKAVEDLQKDKEIMERLNEIKKKKTAKGEGSEEDNEEQYEEDSNDEELAAKKIIKQYLEEVKLEESLGDIPSIDGQPTEAQLKKMNKEEKKSDEATSDKSTKTKKKTVDKKGGKISEKTGEKTGGAAPGDVEDEGEFDPDELPYCCICTNDATIRCLGCDFDLYCAGCFKEGHDKLDMNDHVKVKYTPPKESS